jgi:hypothetical protein
MENLRQYCSEKKLAKRKKAYQEIDLEKAVAILQTYDNSVKMVRGPDGIKQLPARDSAGHYFFILPNVQTQNTLK